MEQWGFSVCVEKTKQNKTKESFKESIDWLASIVPNSALLHKGLLN